MSRNKLFIILPAIFGVLLVILLPVLVFVRVPIADVIAAPSATPAPDQVKYLRRLELGNLDEAKWQLSQAQVSYQAAALADNPEIAQAGKDNYARLVDYQQISFVRFRDTFIWLDIIGLVVIGILLLYRPLAPAYRIAPFTDWTKEQSGKAIHLVLIETLSEIKNVYTTARDSMLVDINLTEADGETPALALYADLLNIIAGLKVGGMSLPVDKFRNILEHWRARNQVTFSGDYYVFGEQIHVVANMNQGGNTETWTLPAVSQAPNVELLRELVQDLTYRILFFILKTKHDFTSYSELRTWTECMRVYQNSQAEPDQLEQTLDRLDALPEEIAKHRMVRYLRGLIAVRMERYPLANEIFLNLIDRLDQSDEISLAAAYQLGQSVWISFDYPSFDAIRNLFERIYTTQISKPKTTQGNRVIARALCSQAAIWAHWSFSKPELKKTDFTQDVEKVEKMTTEAFALCGEAPIRAAAHLARGIVYRNAGRVEDAISEFKTAVDADETYPAALIYLADALTLRIFPSGAPTKGTAEAMLKQWPALSANDRDAVYQPYDKPVAAAIVLWAQSISLRLPGQLYARNKLSDLYVHHARIVIKTKDKDAGLALIEKAIEVDPTNPYALDNLAYRLLDDPAHNDAASLAKAEQAALKAVEYGQGSRDLSHYQDRLEQVRKKMNSAPPA